MLLLVLMLFSLMVLAACRDDTSAKEDANEDDVKVEAETDDQSPHQGVRVTVAMYSAPSGMFNPLFYEDIYDDTILAFTHEALFTQNENLEYEALLAMDNWELKDRKSTRLNSSHVSISYAVFCLKKKKTKPTTTT